MFFDTHTHLQFKAFKGKVDKSIKEALEAGIEKMVVVGTDVQSSQSALELAQKHEGVFAAVGIHPHHIFEHKDTPHILGKHLEQIEKLFQSKKVVAVGETGIDKHHYLKTKHTEYEVNEHFITLQKKAFAAQIKLALTYQKSIIIHNREAVKETLEVLEANWDRSLERNAVFHCFEPDQRLLDYAKNNHIYIGIDGDITFDKAKQDFVKKIPLELLVLETDSPFLVPQGFNFPNTPKNLKEVLNFIAKIRDEKRQELEINILKNSYKLFNL